MSRKPASIAPEATAAIDRAITTLQVLKTHLKAKKPKGAALDNLLSIVMEELREFQEPFNQMRMDDLDAFMSSYRAVRQYGEEP